MLSSPIAIDEEFTASWLPSGPQRWLEEEGDDEGSALSNSDIVKATLRNYGLFYAAALILFEFLRKRYPRLYNTRSWLPGHECELAKTNSYDKPFSWMWGVFQVSETEIFNQCGMDILCFLRAMRFCRNLCIIGVANAVWLLPIYRTAKDSPETEDVTDTLDQFSVANLPSESKRFLATVLAAYILSFATFFMLAKDFEWYTRWRHKFLSQRMIRNYAIYVYGIPKELRSSYQLASYFRSCSTEKSVLEAHVAMDTPQLEKLQTERKGVCQRLEHIKGLENRQQVSMARNGLMLTEKEELVRNYETRLQELNLEIPRRIRATMSVNDKFRSRLKKLARSRNVWGNSGLDQRRKTKDSMESLTIDEGIQEDVNESLPFNNLTERPPNEGDAAMESDSAGEERPSDLFYPNNSAEATLNSESPPSIGMSQKDGRSENADSPVSDEDSAGGHEFLSVLVPGAVDLLSRRASICEATNTSTVDEGQSQSEGLVFPGEETGHESSSAVVEDLTDLEAQTFASQVVYVTQDSGSSAGDMDKEATGRSARPGFNQDGSSSSQDSQKNKGSGSKIGSGSKAVFKSVVYKASAASEGITKGTKFAGKTILKGSRAATEAIATGSKNATSTMKKAAKDLKVDRLVKKAGNFVPVVLNRGEGMPRPGGFVVFSNLYTVQTALQMVHHATPYTMEVQEAPAPEDIFWPNVGMLPRKRRLGSLYSTAASVVLCFFWSAPTAFIASLTSVSTIKEELPRLGDLIEKYPWFEQFVIQLAPMLLLFLNEVVLPEALKWFSMWEGHVSASYLEAGLFRKLSAFMIIQTFFVSAISGSIYSELTNLLKNPDEIIDLLSKSLPSQSTYFMQIIFAATFLIQGIELLRIYPLGCALLRRFVGPNATKKERKKAWMYIYTLEDPPEFWHAETFAQIQILYVMVLLVYAVIAPFTACALLFCFLLLESGYRYQFIHNYPRSSDTGGKLWYTFIQFVLGSLVVSQLTLAGILALEQSIYAGPAMAPLIIVTILYILYLNGRHSHVTRYLPTFDCIGIDEANAKAGRTDFSFWEDAYLQPSLKQFHQYPEYDESDVVPSTT